MHIVGKENMEVFLSKLHYLWNVISLFTIFASNFYYEIQERLEMMKLRSVMFFLLVWFFLRYVCSSTGFCCSTFRGFLGSKYLRKVLQGSGLVSTLYTITASGRNFSVTIWWAFFSSWGLLQNHCINVCHWFHVYFCSSVVKMWVHWCFA